MNPLQVSFDPETQTEKTYDYLTLYGETNDVYYGEEKMSGGWNGTQGNFPGVDGRPPLIINAPRFRVFFHSDGSNQGWGFKLIAVPKVPRQPGEKNDATDIPDLNPAPFYIGQTPSYVSSECSAEAMLGKLVRSFLYFGICSMHVLLEGLNVERAKILELLFNTKIFCI